MKGIGRKDPPNPTPPPPPHPPPRRMPGDCVEWIAAERDASTGSISVVLLAGCGWGRCVLDATRIHSRGVRPLRSSWITG